MNFKNLRNRKLSLKAVSALLICAILLTSFITYTLSNPSLSYTTVIQEGSMVTEASYIIFKDGTTYYARNGKTGNIDYSGTNCSAVVESAYNSDPSLIHFSSGIFCFTHGIIIEDSNVNFEGEGSDNTKLYLNNGANCHLFSITPSTLKNFISIRYMTLCGNKAQQSGQSHGIYVYGYAGDMFFTDLYIDNFLNKGIYILPITRVWNVWIQRCLIEGNDEAGISLNNTVGIHFVHIKDNYIFNNGVGIIVYQQRGRGLEIESNIIYENGEHGILFEGVRYATINDNHIFDNSDTTAYLYDGIYLGKAGSDQTYYVTISDNFICNQGFTNKQRYGINIEDLSDNLGIKDNYLVGNNNASINIASGAATSSEIHGNIGFRTEFYGYAMISASTYVDVTHNLAGTPISIRVTPDNSEDIFWVSNVGSTTFRINVDGSTTIGFYWYAQYKPS